MTSSWISYLKITNLLQACPYLAKCGPIKYEAKASGR